MSDLKYQVKSLITAWDNDQYRDVMLPNLSASTCGEVVEIIKALEARCRELEAERDNLADKIRWMDPLIKEHHDAGQVYWEKWQAAQAHAQKLTEALEPFAETADHDIGTDEHDDDIFQPMTNHNSAAKVTVGDMRRALSALSLTPTSALSAVRDEVTEAMVDAGMQHYSEGGCSGLADYERREVVQSIIEAAIRARKETGE